MSLRLRLSLAFVFVVLAPLLLAALLLSRGVPGFGGDAARQRVATSAAAVSNELSARCSLAGDVANTIAYQSAAGSPQASVVDAVGRDGVSYAAVLGADGKVLAQAGKLPPQAQSALTTQIASNTVAFCDAPTGSNPYAVINGVDLAGSGRAIVGITLDPDTMKAWQDLAGGDITLVRDGKVIASTAAPAAAARYASAAAKAAASGKVVTVNGQLLGAVAQGPDRPVTVVVTARPGLGMTSLTSTLAAVLAAAVVLAVGLGWQLARVTTRPLTELALAARRIADGDLDTPVPDLGGGDEIGRLAGAFDEMTTELRQSIGALQDSRDELRRNLARLGDTLSGTHDLNRILHVILETAMTSVGAQAGAIYLPHSGGGARGDLFQRVGVGVAERGAPFGSRLGFGDGVLGLVAANGEAVRGRIGPGAGELTTCAEEPTGRSLIAVPLRASGRVTGVLGLYDKQVGDGIGNSTVATSRRSAPSPARPPSPSTTCCCTRRLSGCRSPTV